MPDSLYFDWNATTPPHEDVVRAMHDALASAWANPASVHARGRAARAHLDDAREAIATLLGFDARDVTLTSGGTEANNLALHSAFASAEPTATLAVSRLEHPSVTRSAEALEARGVAVDWIAIDGSGRIDLAALAAAFDRDASVKLVALQAVNHETGVVQPIEDAAAIAHAHGARLFVDAVQAVGKIDRSAWRGADLVSIAAHKIRGPKAIGALVTRPGLALAPILRGGAQERGVRPGTQDAALAAGFAVAARRAVEGPARASKLAALRDRIEAELVARGAEINGKGPRAPHVTNVSFARWRGDELAAALDLEGLAVSSGSACSAGTAEPSPVIAAMLGPARASSALRISLGETTTNDDLDRALAIFARVLDRSSR